MESGPRDGKETPRIDIKALPDSVARLWETMLRIEPNWDLSKWLDERAQDELELVEGHLGRERLRLEQRLHRIETLVKRLKRQREVTDGVGITDPNQKNLFDVYENNQESSYKGKKGKNEDVDVGEAIVDFGALGFDDDPLLAIVSEHILSMMERERISGNNVVHYSDLVKKFKTLAIDEKEIDEAISILLQKRMIVELDQDIFGLEN
tara:strand:+ start:8268 stop:8891 length:624 start_codon:yes stop_codon:yes gene_type:complete